MKRRALWDQVVQLKRKTDDEDWCFGGDFNSVLNKDGIIFLGVSYRGIEMEDFS